MPPNRRGLITTELGSGAHEKYWMLSRYADAAIANARVVTARKNPRNRSAGRPTTTATTAPTSPASNSVRPRSRFQCWVAYAATAPPKPANDIWPSDTCPAQPVSTTTDIVMITNTIAADAFNWLPTASHHGSARTRPTTTVAPPHRSARTSGSDRSSADTGRTSADMFQLDDRSWSARVTPTLRTSSETTMTRARIGSTSWGLLGLCQLTPSCRRPTATAETATAGKSTRLPSMRAASAASSTVRFSEDMTGRPWIPA